MNPNEVTRKIIKATCVVHSALGPELLEEPYQKWLRPQLIKEGFNVLSLRVATATSFT